MAFTLAFTLDLDTWAVPGQVHLYFVTSTSIIIIVVIIMNNHDYKRFVSMPLVLEFLPCKRLGQNVLIPCSFYRYY